MKQFAYIIAELILPLFILSSCAKEIVDLTGSIEGTVKDRTSGQLLENCRVSLSPSGKSILTSSSGSFVFEGLDPGSYTVSVSKAGYMDESQTISVVTGQLSSISILLVSETSQKGTIKGVVKDKSSGQLIGNCKVSLMPGGVSISTSSDGLFTFDNLTPGNYSLSFSKSGYVDETQDVSVVAGQISNVSIFLISGTSQKGTIKGVVKDKSSGQLIGNCKVSLMPGGVSISTSSDGSFTFDNLTPGNYSLSFSKSGYVDETQEVSVVAGQISNVSVLLVTGSSLTGTIKGTIKDYDSGQFISNCRISLSPGGESVTSSSSGTYEFSNLTPGDYSLTFAKSGYNDETGNVVVKAGETTTMDILLRSKTTFDISETTYDFGDLEMNKTFFLYNYSDTDCSYQISNIPNWLSFNHTSGTVPALGDGSLVATVDRNKVDEGLYEQNISITYVGKTSGSVILTIKMKKVILTVPTVEIASGGQNVKENSFDIIGTITATGGSQILSYGHCWSTFQNPTVNDNKTDFGTTNAIGSFTSTASNLMTFTTYYVRAYARNAQGITYSDQVAVTTQDVGNDIWDGNIATSFAGGNGSYVNPYIIKTGGQLLLMKNYSQSSYYFELGANINLDNKNWLPFEFNGSLDGKGFAISNLNINRSGDYQGLFSKCGGNVSNISLKQVTINAPSSNYVGAFSGAGGTFNNCALFLGTNSLIIGNNYVGGFSGSNAILSNCEINSSASNAVIRGNEKVGGLLGSYDKSTQSDPTLSACRVFVDIAGASSVGGILGYSGIHFLIERCSYTGAINGNKSVGGILGYGFYYTTEINACKVNATIRASNGYAGGIVGDSAAGSVLYCAKIVGCYSSGTITGNSSGGFAGKNADTHTTLSYSTMTSVSSDFYGFGAIGNFNDCATTHANGSSETTSNCQTSTNNVVSFLKECYSEYASYWNFNSIWTWEGVINGSTIKVNCPKLSWE